MSVLSMKVRGSSLVEVLIASMLIVVIFIVFSNILSALLFSNVSANNVKVLFYYPNVNHNEDYDIGVTPYVSNGVHLKKIVIRDKLNHKSVLIDYRMTNEDVDSVFQK